MQGSINGWRQTTRRAGAAGLTLALAGGLLAAPLTGSTVGAAQTETGTPAATPGLGASCRTALQGDQTSLTLFDLSQFVPVSELGAAASQDAQGAGEAPAIATPLPATAPPAPAEATPDATPIASPIASPEVSPIAGEAAATDALRSLAFGVLNCTNQGDFATLGTLVTDTYLSLTFAGGADLGREDFLALAAVTVIPQQELIAFDNVAVSGDRATAEVISSLGNQLRHEQWSFVRETGGDWTVDRVTALAPLAIAGSVTTTVEIDDRGLRTDPREVESGNVVLLGENSDSVDHEMLVLRLPQGTTTEILLQSAGPEFPEGVVFIGQMTVPAGGEAVLPLMNLPAGNYVVVDMLLDDTGTPNLAQGYRARLIVQ